MIRSILDWLFVPQYTDPEVGQRWRCGWNGTVFEVTAVRVGDSGSYSVTVEEVRDDGRYSIGQTYCFGYNQANMISQWRRALKEEKRSLINPVVINTHRSIPASEYEMPEWAKMDDLGGRVPSNVRLALRDAFLKGCTWQRPPYPTPPSPNPVFGDEDHVLVPRDLLGAACSAIDKKRDGTKTLTELRRYTVGDLSKSESRVPVLSREPTMDAGKKNHDLEQLLLVRSWVRGYDGHEIPKADMIIRLNESIDSKRPEPPPNRNVKGPW